MSVPALRAAILLAAFSSPFLFPYPATFALSLAASAFFPLSGLLIGALGELLYFAPPTAFPLALTLGAIASGLGFLVRRFAKARIMVE